MKNKCPQCEKVHRKGRIVESCLLKARHFYGHFIIQGAAADPIRKKAAFEEMQMMEQYYGEIHAGK